jgi:mRNA interferase MazF
MLRGEVRLTDLAPARSGEAAKRRPAVIVSNDRANAVAAQLGRGVVTVVPVTSNVERVFPFQVLLTAQDTRLRADSKAQAPQVRSVSVERVGPALGRVPLHLMTPLEAPCASTSTCRPRAATPRGRRGRGTVGPLWTTRSRRRSAFLRWQAWR